MANTATKMRVRALTPTIGAEVSGVDLRDAAGNDALMTQIEQALAEHLVLFFRDQHITGQQQVDCMRWFGPFEYHAFAKPHPEHPEMIVLDQTTPQTDGANNWHTDSSFMEHPALGSMLCAVQLPAIGGDTCWASMYAAYAALSRRLRDMLDGMTARHDLTATLQKAIAGGHATGEDLTRFQKEWPPVEHPVIRTHPWTGRRALYVNANFTTRLCELEQAESDTLLEFLLRHLQRPDFQVRFAWDEGSVALWDNRCTQHYAVPDYTGQRRVMNRVTVEGEQPFFDPSLGALA
jgi:taurine dioxygenase